MRLLLIAILLGGMELNAATPSSREILGNPEHEKFHETALDLWLASPKDRGYVQSTLINSANNYSQSPQQSLTSAWHLLGIELKIRKESKNLSEKEKLRSHYILLGTKSFMSSVYKSIQTDNIDIEEIEHEIYAVLMSTHDITNKESPRWLRERYDIRVNPLVQIAKAGLIPESYQAAYALNQHAIYYHEDIIESAFRETAEDKNNPYRIQAAYYLSEKTKAQIKQALSGVYGMQELYRKNLNALLPVLLELENDLSHEFYRLATESLDEFRKLAKEPPFVPHLNCRRRDDAFQDEMSQIIGTAAFNTAVMTLFKMECF